MKKILTSLVLTLISISVFSQNLPQYYIVGKDTLGITLPIEKVKKMKNDLELKLILESMMISCDSTINKFIVVVDDYERKVISLKTTITRLDSSDVNKQKIINSLKASLELEEKNRKLCEESSLKKDTVITNSEKIITNVKTERNWAYLGATTFLITTILLLLIH
jgi:hypothetical protein